MHQFSDSSNIDVVEFCQLCDQETDLAEYPLATSVNRQVLIYDRQTLVDSPDSTIRSELARCLREGPGVFVVRAAFADLATIDRCNDVFQAILSQHAASGQSKGDHFGDNERIWNSLQKTCVADPELFVQYYGNPVLRIVSESWLGPNYRITAQMNNIKPGGSAQSAHRDYHLGFQANETIAKFPVHAQVMSQYLTLQGAIAHCDMPVKTGPTLLLPYSQRYALGYLASQDLAFEKYFDDHHVQLPLAKGDAVFFNPALFHAGGSNRSDRDRIANLIQISSAFGRTMETINHRSMIDAVYPLLRLHNDPPHVENVINVIADGYAFPTNLDSDPPVDGNAPETQSQLVRRALVEGLTFDQLRQRLDQYDARRQA